MRLSEEKIKQGITHIEQFVRDMAVSYFALSFSGDRTVMPIATESLERFGFLNALSDVDLLRNLAQSDKSITWLTSEISRMGSSSDQRQWEYVKSLSWILAEAEVGLLKRRRKDILALRFLDADARNTIEHRTRLLSVSPVNCWSEFNECCRQLGASGQAASNDVLARAYLLLEMISHHPQKFSDQLLSTLSEDTPQDGDLSRRWRKVCAIRATGEMRLTAAVPHLIRFLQEFNEDWVCEECVIALTRIGGDAVVKAVWNACAIAQDEFHGYTAWVLEGIHSDLSEQAALHLFHEADDMSTKIAFGHALLSDFAIDGITAVRNLIRQEEGSDEIAELRSALMAVCTLAEADFPELNEWREQDREDQSQREKWQSPEFPVVDTWSSQLTDATPPPRSEAVPPLPIRIPKLPRFPGVGRNDPCPCKSGKKYKNCCMR